MAKSGLVLLKVLAAPGLVFGSDLSTGGTKIPQTCKKQVFIRADDTGTLTHSTKY